MNLFLLELLRYVFLFLIYLFLYKVIVTIRNDIVRSDPDKPAGYLCVIKSDLKELSEGKKIPIHPPFNLGKSNDNDLVINNGYISNKHLRIFSHNKEIWIEDLNTTNGTLLNEVPLKESLKLKNGDKIYVAGVALLEFIS